VFVRRLFLPLLVLSAGLAAPAAISAAGAEPAAPAPISAPAATSDAGPTRLTEAEVLALGNALLAQKRFAEAKALSG
jgi:hypothetical protein